MRGVVRSAYSPATESKLTTLISPSPAGTLVITTCFAPKEASFSVMARSFSSEGAVMSLGSPKRKQASVKLGVMRVASLTSVRIASTYSGPKTG